MTAAGATCAACSLDRRRPRARACCCRRSSTCRWCWPGRASMRSTMDGERLLGVPSAAARSSCWCRTSSATTSTRTCASWRGWSPSTATAIRSTTRCTSACRSLLLAAVAMLSGRPRTRFWTVVILACAVASLGAAHADLSGAAGARAAAADVPLPGEVPVARDRSGWPRSPRWRCSGSSTATAPRRAVRIVVDRRAAPAAVVTYVAIAWVLIAPTLPIRGFFRLARVGQGARADPGRRVPAVPRAPAPDARCC